MCADIDLFGEVIITRDDVEVWLKRIPRMQDLTRPNYVQQYINDYEVVNKIRAAKLDNSFYSLNDKKPIDNINLSHTLETLMKPRFKPCAHITYAQQQKRAHV